MLLSEPFVIAPDYNILPEGAGNFHAVLWWCKPASRSGSNTSITISIERTRSTGETERPMNIPMAINNAIVPIHNTNVLSCISITSGYMSLYKVKKLDKKMHSKNTENCAFLHE